MKPYAWKGWILSLTRAYRELLGTSPSRRQKESGTGLLSLPSLTSTAARHLLMKVAWDRICFQVSQWLFGVHRTRRESAIMPNSPNARARFFARIALGSVLQGFLITAF